ncbi:Serine/threonine-protein kinase PknD [Bacillus rhizoplanae]|uniref:non-specific serine/threonine protein kinase n=1 Tax=Bacillus rhizoplanae TaxID=2880966 RepID=A0ABM8YGE4_9BACI|nr:protein kinase [Bacillus rhizoplanae]CAG9614910.1 Serine/threonine-protein kinase PknD [Bacillus rhizoplanae]
MAEANEIKKVGADENRRRISSFIKKNNKSITLTLGEISNLEQIGQGGNGLVYAGIQNNEEVAIKFLVEDTQSSKLDRFKAEYFNVNLIEERTNIVNYINYEEIQFEDGYLISAIIMKRYDKALNKLRENTSEISEKTFIKLFNFLLNTLEKIHQHGIIHRDIKPENILVTKETDFVLTDFGIANYNPELYTLKAKTEKKDRLGNYEFSAPEQAKKGALPAPSMDIYALGQVCQWYVFGETHRGTNRSRITDVFKSEEAEVIEIVLNKCLYNNHEQRYQSINEILEHMEQIKESRRKVDPFEEMYLFNDAISATCPSVSRGLQFVEDEKYIKRLVENINKQNFKLKLWFNTGIGNSDFSKLKYLGDKKILLDYKEIKIKGIWLYTGSVYDDLIMLETEENEPFIIDGEETYSALIINNKHIVHGYHRNSGYIEIEDEVYSLSELEVEEHDRSNSYKYYFIGTQYHCSILWKNDYILDGFQEKGIVNKKTVAHLIDDLRKKKHEEVVYRL